MGSCRSGGLDSCVVSQPLKDLAVDANVASPVERLNEARSEVSIEAITNSNEAYPPGPCDGERSCNARVYSSVLRRRPQREVRGPDDQGNCARYSTQCSLGACYPRKGAR